MGEGGGGRHLDVEDDRQLERAQRGQHLALIGEGDGGIAADTHQGPDLPIAGREDLVGEHVDGHLVHEPTEAAEARARAGAPERSGRLHVGMARPWGIQDPRVGDGLAGPPEAAAEAVERDHEVLGHVGARRHVDAGAGHRRAARTRGEEPCGALHACPGNARAPLDVVGREGHDRVVQGPHAVDVRRDERAVVALFLEDQAHHAGKQRGVLARLHLEVNVGDAGQLGTAWIDRDDARAALPGLAEMPEAVGVGRAALARERRHAGVVAHEQEDVRVGEALHAGVPGAVARPAGGLRGLIDGVGREVPGRPDRPHPGDGERLAAAEEPVGPRVQGDGGRPVAREDGGEPGSHLVHRFLAGDVAEAAGGQAPAAAAQAVGMVVLLDQGPPLRTEVAARDDVVAIAAHGDGAAVLDVHFDAADRVAESAEGLVGLHHRGAPGRIVAVRGQSTATPARGRKSTRGRGCDGPRRRVEVVRALS